MLRSKQIFTSNEVQLSKGKNNNYKKLMQTQQS